LTYHWIHQEFNIPLGSIYRLIHGNGTTNSTTSSQYRRKPLFTPTVRSRLINTATASAYNCHLPLAEVAKLANIKTSKRFLRRIFQSESYNRHIARVKPFLTTKAKENRLTWATDFADWTAENFSNVIFSDEAAFNYGKLSGTIWVTCKPGEEYTEDCLVSKFQKTYDNNGLGCNLQQSKIYPNRLGNRKLRKGFIPNLPRSCHISHSVPLIAAAMSARKLFWLCILSAEWCPRSHREKIKDELTRIGIG